MLRQGRLIAVMASLLICCAVLVSHPRGASATEDRCEGTRTIVMMGAGYKTNDVPGCPKGGLLSGTDGADYLYGGEGEDDVRGLGSPGRQFDELYGGYGSDVIYAGPGYDFLYGGQDDDVLHGGDGYDILFIGGPGEDVLYGGDGNDYLDGMDCPLLSGILTASVEMSSGTRSIAVKAGTDTWLTSSTTCREVARRARWSIPAALP